MGFINLLFLAFEFCRIKIFDYLCTRIQTAGCSSARLEYTSGGRVVAGSNPVIPTEEKALIITTIVEVFFVFSTKKREDYPLFLIFLYMLHSFKFNNHLICPIFF